ncbi:general secretion pathway protein GspB [Thiohalobacter sp. IOR34]|uniref:general secretion pathway protein GspB n=1 Tax=Thiohalobacter sp. IOR34 TaxID=3057176 RepID=UPI0025AFEE63|nr:general secretion pathway protein GspB [Thiohalobacter sp. IOR34]WJW75829.1 general secretion pathway protein GspB [Thiohalobacter sp. IOR34]
MSYILEALKKSERERRLGQVPQLDTPQQSLPAAPARARWPWLVGGLLLVNAAAFTWLLLRPVPPAVEEPQLPLAAAPTAAAPPSRVRPMPPEPIESPAPAPQARAAEPAVPEPAPSSPPRGQVTFATAPLDKPPGQPGSAPLPEEPRASAEPPLWREMPEAFRRRVPRPAPEVHVYAEAAERRFVMIGLHKYREGERLPGGLRLETITPTGMVLQAEGRRFRVERQ